MLKFGHQKIYRLTSVFWGKNAFEMKWLIGQIVGILRCIKWILNGLISCRKSNTWKGVLVGVSRMSSVSLSILAYNSAVLWRTKKWLAPRNYQKVCLNMQWEIWEPSIWIEDLFFYVITAVKMEGGSNIPPETMFFIIKIFLGMQVVQLI